MVSAREQRDRETAMAGLHAAIEGAGGKVEEGWRLEIRYRNTGDGMDKYWYPPPPGGPKMRSYLEILRYLNLPTGNYKPTRTKKQNRTAKSKAGSAHTDEAGEANGKAKMSHTTWEPLSRETAIQKAQSALHALQLPLTLGKIKVTSLGRINPGQNFRTDLHIFPVGYTASFEDADAGVFVSSIQDGGDGAPQFCVSLTPLEGESEVIAKAGSPNAVWSNVVQIQAALKDAASLPDTVSNGDSIAVPDFKEPTKSSLLKVRNLDQKSGIQWFGLTTMKVLEAIEGLEGVEAIDGYKYIQEQHALDFHYRKIYSKLGPQKGAAQTGSLKKAGRGETGSADQVQAKTANIASAKPAMKQQKLAFGNHSKKLVENMEGSKSDGKPTASAEKRKLQESADDHDHSSKENRDSEERQGEPSAQKPAKRPKKTSVQVVMNNLVEQVEKTEKRDKAKKPPEAGSQQRKAAPQKMMNGDQAPAHSSGIKGAFKRKQEELAARPGAAAPRTVANVLQPVRPPDADERNFPDGKVPPPKAAPVPGSQHLPDATNVAGFLELWQVLGRFQTVLDLPEIPALEDLAKSLARKSGAQGNSEIFDSAMVALTQSMTSEIVDACLEVQRQVNEDTKGRDFNAPPPLIDGETWVEAARRLFALASMGHQVLLSKEPELSGGLDIALGDFVGSSPIGALGPSVVMPTILGGVIPTSMHDAPATLPVGACASAGSYRHIKQDVLSRIAVLKAVHKDRQLDPAKVELSITTCRNVLRHLHKIKGPRDGDGQQSRIAAISFGGQNAALAAKMPRPIDLHTVAIRNDLGYYAYLRDPLQAFAADVESVCDLFVAAAASKRSAYGPILQKARAPEIVKRVREALGPLIGAAQEGTLKNPDLKAARNVSQQPSRAVSRQASAEPEQAEAPQDDSAQPSAEAAPEEDLSEPLKLGEGCCVCWKDEDRGKILICDGCDQEYHIYCLHPPLTELPDADEWYCGPCQALEKQESPDPLYKQHAHEVPAVCCDDFHQATIKLKGKGPEELSSSERLLAAKLLVRLFVDSSVVRELFKDDESNKKELWTELRDVRAKMKRLNKELLEQQKPQADRPRTRAEKDDETELAMCRSRADELSKLLGVEAGAVRLEPVGHDRLWNRYWVLGKWDADECGTLYVESNPGIDPQASKAAQDRASGDDSEASQWQCIPDIASIDKLIHYLNPRGKRENNLMVSVKRLKEQTKAKEARLAREAREEARQRAENELTENAAQEEAELIDDSPEPERIIPGSEDDQEMPDASSPVDELRTAIMRLRHSTDDAQLEASVVTEADLEHWHAHLETARTSQELLTSLLYLERLLPANRLKPWWQFYSQPAPSSLEGSLASVCIRLKALQAAVKKGPPIPLPRHNATASSGAAAAGPYSFRTRRAAPGALAESNFESKFDDFGAVDDETLARQLQDSYTRNLRRRSGRIASNVLPQTAAVVPVSNGVRATRAAARLQKSAMLDDTSSDESELPEPVNAQDPEGQEKMGVEEQEAKGSEDSTPVENHHE